MVGLGFGAHAAARKTWAALAGAIAPPPPPPPPPPPQSTVPYGRTAGYDAGTAGDYFVNGATGSDANSGLSPAAAFATVGKAITMALSGTGQIVVRVMGDGYRYRENLRPIWTSGNLAKLTIAAYGTDRPWISGANVLTGFEPCTATDEALLGPNYGSMFKCTVPVSAIGNANHWRLILRENEQPMKLAVLRHDDTLDPFFTDATSVMYNPLSSPDLTITTNPTYFNTISHPAVLGVYTDSQLSQAVAALHAYPNVTRFLPVASAVAGVLTLMTNNARPNPGSMGSYALFNVPGAIHQGGWAYRNNGSGSLILYVWPANPASLAGGMELSVRKEALYLTRGAGQEIVLDGLGFEMSSAGEADFASGTVYFNTGSGGTTMRQCHVRDFEGAAGITFKFMDNVRLEHTTIERGRTFGVVTVPTTGGGVYNYRLANIQAIDLSQTGYRCFGLRDSVLSDIKSVRTSAGGHANSINFYQGCDRVAVLRFVGGYMPGERLYAGYGTNQASSRLLFLHCIFPMSEDTRAYVDQSTTGATHPVNPSQNYLINCWVPHEPSRLQSGFGGGQITLGETNPAMNWSVYNTLATKIASTGGTLLRKGNILTDPATPPADPTEAVVADIDTLHVDAGSFDYRGTAGGLLSTAVGYDVETVVAEWEAVFPDIDFRKDIKGRVWNPAQPGVGPLGRSW